MIFQRTRNLGFFAENESYTTPVRAYAHAKKYQEKNYA